MKVSLYIIFFVSVLIPHLGCKSIKDANEDLKIEPEKIIVNLHESQTLRFSEMFSPPVFIPLETTDKSLISSISQLVISDSIFFIVVDEPSGMIQQFSPKGNHLRTIFNKGRGPDEYLNLYYIDIDPSNNTIIFWEPLLGIVRMDYLGNIISKIKLPEVVSYAVVLHPSENLYLIETSCGQIINRSVKQEDSYFHFCTYNPESGKLTPWLKRTSGTRLVGPPSFSFYNKDAFYLPLNWDTVYLVGESTVSPAYYFDFGKHTKPKGFDNESDQTTKREMSATPGFVYQHIRFHITDEYLISTHEINRGKPIFHIYYKKSQQTKVFNCYINDYLGQTAERSLIRYIRSWFIDNYMIIAYEPTELIKSYYSLKERMSASDFKRFNSQNKYLSDIIRDIKEDDNPVLAFYKIK